VNNNRVRHLFLGLLGIQSELGDHLRPPTSGVIGREGVRYILSGGRFIGGSAYQRHVDRRDGATQSPEPRRGDASADKGNQGGPPSKRTYCREKRRGVCGLDADRDWT